MGRGRIPGQTFLTGRHAEVVPVHDCRRGLLFIEAWAMVKVTCKERKAQTMLSVLAWRRQRSQGGRCGYAVSKERKGPSGFCCRSEPSQGLAAGLSHEQGRSPNFFLAKGGLVLNAGTEVEVRNGAVS